MNYLVTILALFLTFSTVQTQWQLSCGTCLSQGAILILANLTTGGMKKFKVDSLVKNSDGSVIIGASEQIMRHGRIFILPDKQIEISGYLKTPADTFCLNDLKNVYIAGNSR